MSTNLKVLNPDSISRPSLTLNDLLNVNNISAIDVICYPHLFDEGFEFYGHVEFSKNGNIFGILIHAESLKDAIEKCLIFCKNLCNGIIFGIDINFQDEQ